MSTYNFHTQLNISLNYKFNTKRDISVVGLNNRLYLFNFFSENKSQEGLNLYFMYYFMFTKDVNYIDSFYSALKNVNFIQGFLKSVIFKIRLFSFLSKV